MGRIRPPVPVVLPGVVLGGSARKNGGTTHHPTVGANNPLPQISLIGNAVRRSQAQANKQASGATPLSKLSISNGAALARRRSKGQGVSPMPLRGVALSATGLRIDADTAVVQLFNSSGNPAGFGPSPDPDGVFYGDTSLVSGDVWWPSSVPAGCTVTPLPGGSYTLAVGGGVTPGSYSFTVNLRRGIGGVRSTTSKSFVVT